MKTREEQVKVERVVCAYLRKKSRNQTSSRIIELRRPSRRTRKANKLKLVDVESRDEGGQLVFAEGVGHFKFTEEAELRANLVRVVFPYLSRIRFTAPCPTTRGGVRRRRRRRRYLLEVDVEEETVA